MGELSPPYSESRAVGQCGGHASHMGSSCSIFCQQRVFLCRAIPRANFDCGGCFAGKSVGGRVWGAGLTAEITAPGGVPELQEPGCDPRYWVWGFSSGTPHLKTPLKASGITRPGNKCEG